MEAQPQSQDSESYAEPEWPNRRLLEDPKYLCKATWTSPINGRTCGETQLAAWLHAVVCEGVPPVVPRREPRLQYGCKGERNGGWAYCDLNDDDTGGGWRRISSLRPRAALVGI